MPKPLLSEVKLMLVKIGRPTGFVTKNNNITIVHLNS